MSVGPRVEKFSMERKDHMDARKRATFLFYTLFGKIWSKKSNCQFKLKFCTNSNSNKQNSMVIFFFFFFETGYTLFGQIWSKKSISLCRNLVLRLIRIWRIQWWCSFFLFMTRSLIFFWKLIPRNQYCLLKLKYRT